MLGLERFTNLRAPSMPTRVITMVLALGFLTLGVAEIISPARFATGYGVPLAGTEGLAFLSAVGARNIALSFIAIVAAVTGLRATLYDDRKRTYPGEQSVPVFFCIGKGSAWSKKRGRAP